MGWNPFSREKKGGEQGKEFRRKPKARQEFRQQKPNNVVEFSPSTPEDASRIDAQKRIAAVMEAAAFTNSPDAQLRIDVINEAKRLEIAMKTGSELIAPEVLAALEQKAAGLDQQMAA